MIHREVCLAAAGRPRSAALRCVARLCLRSGLSARTFQALSDATDATVEADDLAVLDAEYNKLKVNWFPGHMVKATKVIRDKLKQVDMVFEVRDARIPFSSANADLDRIVGPGKARLIILNKADLANPALEQRVLQRFQEQGKPAIYACGRTGANINKLLTWAWQQGARRGEFSTTGAVAMVVGMPNVGKSSLINLLRGKAMRKEGGGGEGFGEDAKQVARVGAAPGVTRQVSAFRIASNPPLYLVDTPGVMVPRVDTATVGLRLALTRAVPDSIVPRDALVAFMLRVVRLRRQLGSKSAGAPTTGEGAADADRRTSRGVREWMEELAVAHPPALGDAHRGDGASWRRCWAEGDDEVEALLEAVARESGAEGKAPVEARRICCDYVLKAFREGEFGRITLDSVPRRKSSASFEGRPPVQSSRRRPEGWATGVLSLLEDRQREVSGGEKDRARPTQQHSGGGERLAHILDRDWSDPRAWDRGQRTGSS